MDIAAGLRDLSQNLASGDSMEAALDAAGLIPLLGKAGDGAKVVKIILKYLKKFPAKAAELSKVMTRVVLKHAPLDSSRVYKAMGYDDAVARLKADGLADGDIERLVGKLDDGKSLEDVRTAAKVGEEVVYITNKRWEHIRKRHITGVSSNAKYSDFFPTGRKIPSDGARTARDLPGNMDTTQIQELIFLTYKRGEEVIDDAAAKTFDPNDAGLDYGIDQMRVIVADGKVISGYPQSGSKVWRWDSDKADWIRNPDLV